ncbi:MAG: hypothetical protein NW241_21460 [Bacteroidia bacterium]|nr:hypothetical protein [Bacteroidia bacterium]
MDQPVNKTFLTQNQRVLILFGFALFCLGGMLQSERLRRREFREQYNEIRSAQKAIEQRLDSVYQASSAREKALLAQLEAAYKQLDTVEQGLQQGTLRAGDLKTEIHGLAQSIRQQIEESKSGSNDF